MVPYASVAFAILSGIISSPQSVDTSRPGKLPVLAIQVDQPAYTGEPIWITATAGDIGNLRYPFGAVIEDIGCNQLEVKRNGLLLKPFPALGFANLGGIICGSAAPAGSPPNRLPLHALFPMDQAGQYAIRWTVLSPRFSNIVSLEPDARSVWTTFRVRSATEKQREVWLESVLANPPKDPGHLAGDYIPSLLAAGVDARVLLALVKCLHEQDQVVSGMAAAALERFPPADVRRAVVDTLIALGPSDELAYFLSHHAGWTLDQQSRIVFATLPYLQPPTTILADAQAESHAAFQNSSAFTHLSFIFPRLGGAWPSNPQLQSLVEAKILQVAPDVIARADVLTIQKLAESLGSMQPSMPARQFLLKIAQRPDSAGSQARICLDWHR